MTTDPQAQMIARLTGPGPTAEQRETSRAWADDRRAALLDTAVACVPDPETGRCHDTSCPTCWLDFSTAPEPVRKPTTHDGELSHMAWRAAWIVTLVRIIQEHVTADAELRASAHRSPARQSARDQLAADPLVPTYVLADALVSDDVPSTLPAPVIPMWQHMCSEGLDAVQRLGAGHSSGLIQCASMYALLRREADWLAGGEDVTRGYGPSLTDAEASERPMVLGYLPASEAPPEEETP
ncbi:hypothetical protein ACXYTP_21645 [Tsukamurella ocularis]